jgi:hypothetical protein
MILNYLVLALPFSRNNAIKNKTFELYINVLFFTEKKNY